MKKRFDLLVIGELNVDLILTGADLIPRFGQAEQLVEDATMALGGSSAILACAAAKLGLKVAFAGKVGRDDFGNFVQNQLKSRGVEPAGVREDASQKTGLTVHLSQPQDRAMLTFPGSMADFSGQEVDSTLIRQARHVHVSSYFLQTHLQPSIAGFFEQAQQGGATTSLDPGWDPAEDWNAGIEQVLRHLNVFLPNCAEAMAITHTHSCEQALLQLANRIPYVVIKQGSKGAISHQDGQDIYIPSFPVQPIDTTGAGDNFNAGFLYGHLQGFDLKECMRWGCACGALATLQVGGLDGQHTSQEVIRWLHEHQNIDS